MLIDVYILAVTVQGQNVPVSSNSSLAIIDINAAFIIGPPSDVAAIYAAIPGSSYQGDGFYAFRTSPFY